MPELLRPNHQRVLKLLDSLSADLLETAACFFGGGTRIVLELDEYRESLDVDFLCANQEGYRELRNEVSQDSLGAIFVHQLTLLREVRADMYGIRTFVEVDGQPVKFEIIREARVQLDRVYVPNIPVPCLDHASAVAEKFLANTDRGLDKSARSRDLIDLAFMTATWAEEDLEKGLAFAEAAYGASVLQALSSAIDLFSDDAYRKLCVAELEVSGKGKLDAGLGRLTERLIR